MVGGIAVDAEGNAYVAGATSSTDFPTANAMQPQFGGGVRDAFIAKLNPSGTALIYSTYLGGSEGERSNGIVVDAHGNAYLTGIAVSPDFPLVNPLQPARGGPQDAWVAKLNPAGSALVYSTYLGGSDLDSGWGIAVDSDGSAYLTGSTRSTDFPTANALQPEHGGTSDAFVAKVNAGGTALIYSTYLGGSDFESGTEIAVDAQGSAYVAGGTQSTDFPTVNALQPEHGGDRDVIVAKLNAAGSALVYSTYLGGSNFDNGLDMTVDAGGNAYVTGSAWSPNFPTAHALQPALGGFNDAFVAKIGDCAEEVTHRVRISGSGFYYNPRTRRFSQLVWVQNRSRSPIQGPVSLVLDQLTADVTLVNRSGVTTCAPPLGSPYKDVSVGRDDVLRPREVAVVVLEFTTPSFSGIGYRPRVLAGPGNR
jgi:hypothetical protein